MIASGESAEQIRWRATHEERDQLAQSLQAIKSEIMRLREDGRYFQDRLQVVTEQGQTLQREEGLLLARSDRLKQEIAEMQGDNAFQNAREREAEEARRHTKTVYDPLPRIVDGYLAIARSCPSCDAPPEQLSWTHHVDIQSGPGGEFTASSWATACPRCGGGVETIPEWVP